jgi:endonuclease/exonuclease/phosphatase family metal-dependent hydrolase
MLAGRSDVILCGDFNIFRGTRELQSLAESCNLKIVNSNGATFPAANPKRTLDLFLCPKDLHHVSAEVMSDMQGSDHLPVLLTVGA